MREARRRAGALIVAALLVTRGAQAVPPPPRPTLAPPPQPPPPTRYATQYTTVRAWLDACVTAPRNGLNPQLDPPTPAVLEAGLAELSREAQSAGADAVRDRRRCATHVLSRHVSPARMHSLWVTLLRRSRDEQVRWDALYALQLLHDEQDLPLVLRQFVEAPALHHPLGAWLRAWRSRAAVPCLAALVLADARAVSENAALSLRAMPDVPSLSTEEVRGIEIHGAPRGSLAAPYARWWRTAGRAAFAQEEQQWQQLLQSVSGPVVLEPPWGSP